MRNEKFHTMGGNIKAENSQITTLQSDMHKGQTAGNGFRKEKWLSVSKITLTPNLRWIIVLIITVVSFLIKP